MVKAKKTMEICKLEICYGILLVETLFKCAEFVVL